MNHVDRLLLRFHPVGQGLFASGELRDGRDKSRFRWVYDCGTASSQSLVNDAIAEFHRHCRHDRPRLDMVVVSHFDRDHISGLVQLLKTFSVGTLILPHVPLWQRLVVAFDAGVSSRSWAMRFFLSPVAYLTGLRDIEIDRIVVVPGAGADDRASDSPASNGTPAGNLPEEPPGNDVALDTMARDEWEEDLRADIDAVHERAGRGRKVVPVMVLKRGGTVRWRECWEFVPYNDAHVSSKPVPAFGKRVEALRSALLKSPSAEALGKLKDLYDRRFGTNGKARNIISLFLYAGPIGRHAFEAYGTHGVCGAYERSRQLPHFDGPFRASIIYTGDGYLDTTARIDRFMAYLRPDRAIQPLCFQVMHHGSRGNWQEGLASKVRPGFSIFSSDPANKKLRHPHGEVVRDFLHYGPIQVDTSHGAWIECYIRNL